MLRAAPAQLIRFDFPMGFCWIPYLSEFVPFFDCHGQCSYPCCTALSLEVDGQKLEFSLYDKKGEGEKGTKF